MTRCTPAGGHAFVAGRYSCRCGEAWAPGVVEATAAAIWERAGGAPPTEPTLHAEVEPARRAPCSPVLLVALAAVMCCALGYVLTAEITTIRRALLLGRPTAGERLTRWLETTSRGGCR